MRTSWTLFVGFVLLFWELWDYVPLLTRVGSIVGSLVIILLASHWLSRFVWKKLFVKRLPSDLKSVLVTGCDTGFGHALAVQLSKEGFLVFAGCLNGQGDGAKSLRELTNVRVLQLDVTQDEQVEAALSSVKQELGYRVLWCVVANAAIRTNGLLEWVTMDSITKIFDVNLFGTLRVTKKFLPLLKKSNGRMIVVSSPFGHLTMPMGVPYCMTKHALVSMVDGLRRECQGKGVDFIAVEPIAYKTQITANLDDADAVQEELQRQAPEVIADYSADEIQHWLTTVRLTYDTLARDDINEVVETIMLAVRETYPKTRYISPFRLAGFVYYLPMCLPSELADLLLGSAIKTLPFTSRILGTAHTKKMA